MPILQFFPGHWGHSRPIVPSPYSLQAWYKHIKSLTSFSNLPTYIDLIDVFCVDHWNFGYPSSFSRRKIFIYVLPKALLRHSPKQAVFDPCVIEKLIRLCWGNSECDDKYAVQDHTKHINLTECHPIAATFRQYYARKYQVKCLKWIILKPIMSVYGSFLKFISPSLLLINNHSNYISWHNIFCIPLQYLHLVLG